MAWKSYGLDQTAQKLVLNARKRGDGQSLNQSHKMRMAVSYGLERFWGEPLRLRGDGKKLVEVEKAKFWEDTWGEMVEIMALTGVTIPNDKVNVKNPDQIEAMSKQLWNLTLEEQRVSLAVLTQLCDCIVWWTQRYKVGRLVDEHDS